MRRPNIIILILDAVRAKQVSAYGYWRKTTPQIDAFAAEAILFRHAFTTSTWTIPTHASLLTGLYLSQHRIESVKADRRFNEVIVTLPALLQSCGYRTAAFSQNTLFSPNYHLCNDFDEYYGSSELLNARYVTRIAHKIFGDSSSLSHTAKRYLRKVIAPRLLLDAVYDWLNTAIKNGPIFLVANIASAHYAWAPPPGILLRNIRFNPTYLLKNDFVSLDPFAYNSGNRHVTETHRQIWRNLYDAALMHTDREVGRFLARFHRGERKKDTIIAITADHGEMLGDYRDIVGHTLSLHDNLIRIPLIVYHPEYPKGIEVKGVVQLLDLFSSILEWADASHSTLPTAQLQRPSLSKAIANPNDTSGFAFAEEDYTDSYDLISGLLSVNPSMNPEKYPRRQIAVRSYELNKLGSE